MTRVLRRCKPLLGTFIELTLEGEGSHSDFIHLSENLFQKIQAVERRMSFFDRDSELSMINRRAHIEPVEISPQMQQLLEFCLKLYRSSSGVFDITVAATLIRHQKLPASSHKTDPLASSADIEIGEGWVRFHRPLLIDLGGVAKGYAVDQAVANCAPELRLLVNAGGDLRATHWQSETIQLRLPEDPLKLISVPLKGSAIATSAGYFQTYASALVDPVSRTPVKMSQSVSVFAPTCMLADALTKVALLHPNPGPLLHSMRAEAIVVDEFGDIHDL